MPSIDRLQGRRARPIPDPRRGAWFRRVCGVALSLGILAASAPSMAAPPRREFLEGLRTRQYYDLALAYLDQLEADPQTPSDLKAVVDFERAVTLIGIAGEATDPGTQSKRLDEATAAMEWFVKAHPDHPLVAEAQTERGKILLGKARVSILEAKSPGNEGKAKGLLQDARGRIAEARKIFESARARFEQQWKSYGSFVEEDNAAKRQSRNEAQNALIQSRLNLAECTYREAQTYPDDKSRRDELLNKAADQYEQIHADYRDWVGGLFARLWMAKCYEEQAPRPDEGETLSDAQGKQARQMLNIAEAIYSELLEHDTSESPSARRMQAYAFWFKLIVRNHPAQRDHQLVVDLASEWLTGRRGAETRTTMALGIRWERAQAYEALADARDVPEGDRTRLLGAALDDAEFVNAFPGQFRDVSRAMIQRVKVALGRGEGDPKDFDAAYGLAQTLQNQIAKKKKAIDAAKTPEEKQTAQNALDAHLRETARILNLALSFAQPSTGRTAVNNARYRLAYVNYERGRLYDTAVLGSFVGGGYKDVSPQLALDASYLAMAAFYKMYDESNAAGRQFALGKLRETADFITKSFPDSEQANESRMMLGRLYVQAENYGQAAQWFSQVPATSGESRKARLLAGTSFWNAYVAARQIPEEDQPPAKQMDKLKTQAEKFLREGLDLAAKQLPAEAKPSEELIAGKLRLAQIANLDGNYQEAIDLLTKQPRAVTAAIAVEKGASRPDSGVTSAPFATAVHQQLLRAYIGLQQMNPAIQEMQSLQSIGGEGNTAVFVDLGRQIKNELEEMPDGPERDKVMSAFDQFLAKLSEMQQGQTFASLFWIGETYFGLAEAAAEPKRSNYFDQAAQSYQTILNRAQEPGFLPSSDTAIGVRLRLAKVTATRGNFQRAYELARQVLKQAPRALNAQVATAEILKDWGHSGRAEAPEKLLLSIQGDQSGDVYVWGWGQIAARLQRNIASGRATAEFQELYRQARYEIPAARHAYAETRSDQEQFQETLNKAEKELNAYVATTPKSEIGSEWWSRFEALYKNIRQDQGIVDPAQLKLEPATEYTSKPSTPETENLAKTDDAAASSKSTPGTGESTEASQQEPASSLPIVFGLLLAGGVTGGIVYGMFRGNKRKPIRTGPDRFDETPIAVPDFEARSPRRDKPRSQKPTGTSAKSSSRSRERGESSKPARKASKPRRVRSAEQSGRTTSETSRRSSDKPRREKSSEETPKPVKPRVVKKARRTKPSE